MIDTIQEIVLGQEALDYVRDSLRVGKELAAYLLKALTLESGRVRTFLPVGLPTTEINRFSAGGKLPMAPVEKRTLVVAGKSAEVAAAPLPNLDVVLASTIKKYLNSEADALCLFENALASPGDGWLSRAKVHSVVTKSSVYHILRSEDTDSELIQQTVAKSKSIRPPLLGILAHYPLASSRFKSGTIEPADLQKIAERTEELLVGAYDGEGFLIWSR
jgi:hypothetical protein